MIYLDGLPSLLFVLGADDLAYGDAENNVGHLKTTVLASFEVLCNASVEFQDHLCWRLSGLFCNHRVTPPGGWWMELYQGA